MEDLARVDQLVMLETMVTLVTMVQTAGPVRMARMVPGDFQEGRAPLDLLEVQAPQALMEHRVPMARRAHLVFKVPRGLLVPPDPLDIPDPKASLELLVMMVLLDRMGHPTFQATKVLRAALDSMASREMRERRVPAAPLVPKEPEAPRELLEVKDLVDQREISEVLAVEEGTVTKERRERGAFLESKAMLGALASLVKLGRPVHRGPRDSVEPQVLKESKVPLVVLVPAVLMVLLVRRE